MEFHTLQSTPYGGAELCDRHFGNVIKLWKQIHATIHEFANECEKLIDNQIQIIGGCCGVTDKHLKKLIERYS